MRKMDIEKGILIVLENCGELRSPTNEKVSCKFNVSEIVNKLPYFTKKNHDIAFKIITKIYKQIYHLEESRQIVFSRNPYGKPFIDSDRSFHFSISYVEEMIAIFICNQNVGIDIEKIDRMDYRIAKRFYSEREKNFTRISGFYQKKRICKIWTNKEAFQKFTGMGLYYPLTIIDTLDPDIMKKTKHYFYKGNVICIYTETPLNRHRIYTGKIKSLKSQFF